MANIKGANSLPNITSIVMYIFIAGKTLSDKNKDTCGKTWRKLSKEILDIIDFFKK